MASQQVQRSMFFFFFFHTQALKTDTDCIHYITIIYTLTAEEILWEIFLLYFVKGNLI